MKFWLSYKVIKCIDNNVNAYCFRKRVVKLISTNTPSVLPSKPKSIILLKVCLSWHLLSFHLHWCLHPHKRVLYKLGRQIIPLEMLRLSLFLEQSKYQTYYQWFIWGRKTFGRRIDIQNNPFRNVAPISVCWTIKISTLSMIYLREENF